MAEHHHTSLDFISTLIPLLIVGGVLVLYVFAAISQRRAIRPWSGWRTASFVVGCALLVLAFSPLLHSLTHDPLQQHMIQHLLIGMYAPLGLVLAAPLTLALRTLPLQTARLITVILGSWPLRLISHPVSALILNIGGMYLLYLTPLYSATLTNQSLHYLVHFHFLAAGYLFVWAIAGPDPAPHRPGMQIRLIVLFIGTAAHATLSKLMYAYLWPRGVTDSAEQIRSAAKLMYYGGDLAELLLMIVLFATWYSVRQRRYNRLVRASVER